MNYYNEFDSRAAALSLLDAMGYCKSASNAIASAIDNRFNEVIK